MLARVDFHQAQWRWLYQPLYERLLLFGLAHHWTVPDVDARMMRLVGHDETLHLLVEMEDITTIKGHCLITFTPTTAFCEQMEADSASSAKFVEMCLGHIDTLRATYMPALAVMGFATTEKKYKAFVKRYGFAVERVVMRKEIGGLPIKDIPMLPVAEESV